MSISFSPMWDDESKDDKSNKNIAFIYKVATGCGALVFVALGIS